MAASEANGGSAKDVSGQSPEAAAFGLTDAEAIRIVDLLGTEFDLPELESSTYPEALMEFRALCEERGLTSQEVIGKASWDELR